MQQAGVHTDSPPTEAWVQRCALYKPPGFLPQQAPRVLACIANPESGLRKEQIRVWRAEEPVKGFRVVIIRGQAGQPSSRPLGNPSAPRSRSAPRSTQGPKPLRKSGTVVHLCWAGPTYAACTLKNLIRRPLATRRRHSSAAAAGYLA